MPRTRVEDNIKNQKHALFKRIDPEKIELAKQALLKIVELRGEENTSKFYEYPGLKNDSRSVFRLEFSSILNSEASFSEKKFNDYAEKIVACFKDEFQKDVQQYMDILKDCIIFKAQDKEQSWVNISEDNQREVKITLMELSAFFSAVTAPNSFVEEKLKKAVENINKFPDYKKKSDLGSRAKNLHSGLINIIKSVQSYVKESVIEDMVKKTDDAITHIVYSSACGVEMVRGRFEGGKFISGVGIDK